MFATRFTVMLLNSSKSTSGGITDIANNYTPNGMQDMSRETDRQTQLGKENLYSGGRANLERMTVQTGGHSYWSSKYGDDVVKIADSLAGQYLLLFVPAANSPGAHQLKINCAKAKIAAPAFFLVGTPEEAKK